MPKTESETAHCPQGDSALVHSKLTKVARLQAYGDAVRPRASGRAGVRQSMCIGRVNGGANAPPFRIRRDLPPQSRRVVVREETTALALRSVFLRFHLDVHFLYPFESTEPFPSAARRSCVIAASLPRCRIVLSASVLRAGIQIHTHVTLLRYQCLLYVHAFNDDGDGTEPTAGYPI